MFFLPLEVVAITSEKLFISSGERSDLRASPRAPCLLHPLSRVACAGLLTISTKWCFLARRLVSSLRRNVFTSLAPISPWAGGGEGLLRDEPEAFNFKVQKFTNVTNTFRAIKGTSTVISLSRIIKRLVSGAQSIVLRPMESSRLRVESFN